MKISLHAKDEQGTPIAGALFSFNDANGKQVAQLSGDAGGLLQVDTEMDAGLFTSGGNIRVTKFGYNTAGNDVDTVKQYNHYTFTLQKGINTGLIVAGSIGIGALLYHLSKKKKVGAVTANQVTPWLLPAGIIIGGIVLYNKFFGKSAEKKAYDDALNKGIAEASAKTPQVKTDAELAIIADTLDEDMHYSWDVNNNQIDVLAQFERINNLAELLIVIKFFGNRYMYVFGIPKGTYTLQQMVHASMSADNINLINKYLSNAGIDFQF